MQEVRVKYSVDTADLKRADKDIDSLSKSEKALLDQVKKTNQEASKQGKAFTESTQQASRGVEQSRKGLDSLGQGANKLTDLLAGAFAVGSILAFGNKVIEITAQFQKLNAVLATALGSDSAGQRAFAQIQDFAARTNFSVLEVTDSFVKLTNSGFKPTTQQLENLADVANSTGKGFDQLTEAIIDAQTGEFERLKEFGIRASKEGDNVKFTFKGVETQTKFTSKAIQDYIVGLGDLNGVQGTTSKISLTLGGQISNLGDAFDSLFNTIGQGSSGIVSTALAGITQYVQILTEGIKAFNAGFSGLQDLANKEIITESTLTAVNEFLQKSAEDRDLILEGYEIAIKERSLRIGKLVEQQILSDNQTQKAALEERIQALLFVQDQEKDAYEALLSEQKRIFDQLRQQEKADIEARKKAKAKELEDLLKLQEAFNKAIANADLDFFKSQVALRESVFGQDDLIAVNRNAVAAREALTREFSAAYKKIKEDGDRLVKAGLLSQSRLDIVLNLKTEEFQTQIAEIDQDVQNFVDKFKLEPIVPQSVDVFKDLEARTRESMERMQEAYERDVQKKQEAEERKRELIQQTYDLGIELVNAGFEIASNRRQAELQDIQAKEESQLKLVGDNQQAQEFIRARAAADEKRIKQQQAKADKAQAIFNIGISTATAIIKTLSQLGVPAGLPFAAIAAALGAVQIAVVASKPVPKFKDGVLDLKGPGTATSDSIHAMLSRGESVMTARETQDFMPTLRAIRAGSVSPELLNAIARPNYAEIAKNTKVEIRNQQSTELLDEVRMLRRQMKNLKQVNVNMDKKGIQSYIKDGNSVTEILNTQFSL